MSWHDRALCRDYDPEAWFPSPRGNPLPALAVCADCDVREACLEVALATDAAGVWGGLTEAQRRRIKRRRAAA